MGQEDVLKVLEQSLRPLSAAEIIEMSGQTRKTVFKSLEKLLKGGFIQCLLLDTEFALKMFRSKHPLRLYFVDGAVLNKEFIEAMMEILELE